MACPDDIVPPALATSTMPSIGPLVEATLFHKDGDYAAFAKVLKEAKEWLPIRLLGWCVLPNHWHLLLWPHRDGELSEFLRKAKPDRPK